MRQRNALLLIGLTLLTVPGALAHSGVAHEATTSSLDCTGAIDFACVHIDCTTTFCIRMFCPVYIGHSGHFGAPGFGCTPP